MDNPNGRSIGNLNDNELFELFRDQALSLSRIMDQGMLRFEELSAIAEKVAHVRMTDDGFGKVVIELSLTNQMPSMRIRTVQDKVIRSLPFERDL